MRYLVDANNLAGKMKMLDDKKFDQKLIELVRLWPKLKNNRVTLVFDPVDTMGDKETRGNLTVIYAPRDEHYQSADDKIIELVEEYFYNIREAKILRDELTVITDDLEIIKRIEDINHHDIHHQSSVWLAGRLFKISVHDKSDVNDETAGGEDNRGLCEKDVKEINDELRKIWR